MQLDGTIKSGSWERAIKAEIPEIEVINKACPMLATVAEEGKAKGIEGRRAIKEYMVPFKKRHIQNIVLGCTHYPIFDEIIKEELGYPVNLINTGKSVAMELKKYLNEHSLDGSGENKIREIIFSRDTIGASSKADGHCN